jgi:hypothetical protein
LIDLAGGDRGYFKESFHKSPTFCPVPKIAGPFPTLSSLHSDALTP